MKEQILRIIKKTFEFESIDETISRSSCEKWDSINHLNLMIELENEFNIYLKPEEIAEMKDIRSILEICQQHVNARTFP